LAQIAVEMRRTVMKEPGSISLDDFLLKFTSGKKYVELPKTDEERREIASASSKAVWFGLTQIAKNPPVPKGV